MQKVFLKICFIFWGFLYCSTQVYADFGNEWIQPQQRYFKIKTASDGIYRLTYAQLMSAGFPASSVNINKIQLFHRGVEQAVFIKGTSGNPLTSGDYIEFYGKRNDGTLDTELYITAEAHVNQYLNLYSDTTAYFLTWRDDGEGKRMSLLSEEDNLPKEVYHLAENQLLLHDEFSSGRLYPVGISGAETNLSVFDYGEGWTGHKITAGKPREYLIADLEALYTSGPEPKLEMLVVGRTNGQHSVKIEVGASLEILGNIQVTNTDPILITKDIAWNHISPEGTLNVKFSINQGSDPGIAAVMYIRLIYPQHWDMGGFQSKRFNLKANPQNKSFIEILNAPATPVIYDITHADNPAIVDFNKVADKILAVVPNTATVRNLLVRDANDYTTPPIQEVFFQKINPSDYNYLIISNKKLMLPDGQYTNPVKAYADYRASGTGGGFKTLVTDIDQLYDQFCYGETTPLAIRRFAAFMLDGGEPAYLFLIGRGLSVNYAYHRSPQDFTDDFEDLVPTAGYPGSDIALTAGLNNTVHEPAIPTGRLTARSPSDVTAYLNKVKEAEALPTDLLWKKRLVHLSGGKTLEELEEFKYYVEEFKKIAEGPFLGGEVSIKSKTSKEPVEFINIAEEVNAGLLFITFFGHSSTISADIDIGYVSSKEYGYDNKGKYPMILVNGCNAGNIFSPTYTFGEDWVVTANKGAIGLLAHSGTGYNSQLRWYTERFYKTAFGDISFIDQSVGVIQKELAKIIVNDERTIAQLQQTVLQGDPALKIFGRSLPDYTTSDGHLFIHTYDGKPLTAATDSFAVAIITHNFGIVSEDSFRVSLTRRLSDGTKIDYEPQLFAPVFHQDTLYFTIKNEIKEGFGNNQFDVYLDDNHLIPEDNENNNQASFNHFIPLTGTVNLFPANFSIVNKQPVRLMAQSGNMEDLPQGFVFELDTTDTFDSPFKQSLTTSGRVFAVWENLSLLPDIGANDSIVYYWRTKLSGTQDNEAWTLSSFIYIKNSPEGWSQAHFPQFRKNQLAGILRDDEARKWAFEDGVTSGSISSPKIGPALSWGTLYTYMHALDNPQNDHFEFEIIGIDFEGNEAVLPAQNIQEIYDISWIDALQYPFIKLQVKIQDEIDFTPSQLKKWQVIYEAPPEGILLLDQPLNTRLPLERQEGEILDIYLKFLNVSSKDFQDSLTVRYTVFNTDERKSEVKYLKINPLSSGDSARFGLSLNTLGKTGSNDLNVYVNPLIIPERYYHNNIVDIKNYLKVNADTVHPVLDVTFDGRYIMDGEIVSTAPMIMIKIKDENKYLFKKDTTGIDILLRSPCEQCVYERISFTDPDLTWTAASAEQDFTIALQRADMENGIYALRVQATDASGNKSGINPYQVHFEVFNKAEIIDSHVYPNPFSDEVHFVTTWAGSNTPEQVIIQILTTTGQVVRELTQKSVHTTQTGEHIYEFIWDGSGVSGSQLPNGMYLYRLLLQSEGVDIRKKASFSEKAKRAGRVILRRR